MLQLPISITQDKGLPGEGKSLSKLCNSKEVATRSWCTLSVDAQRAEAVQDHLLFWRRLLPKATICIFASVRWERSGVHNRYGGTSAGFRPLGLLSWPATEPALPPGHHSFITVGLPLRPRIPVSTDFYSVRGAPVISAVEQHCANTELCHCLNYHYPGQIPYKILPGTCKLDMTEPSLRPRELEARHT